MAHIPSLPVLQLQAGGSIGSIPGKATCQLCGKRFSQVRAVLIFGFYPISSNPGR
jgi:hypothetical protein